MIRVIHNLIIDLKARRLAKRISPRRYNPATGVYQDTRW